MSPEGWEWRGIQYWERIFRIFKSRSSLNPLGIRSRKNKNKKNSVQSERTGPTSRHYPTSVE